MGIFIKEAVVRTYAQIKHDIKKGKPVDCRDAIELGSIRFRIILAALKAAGYDRRLASFVYEKEPAK